MIEDMKTTMPFFVNFVVFMYNNIFLQYALIKNDTVKMK